MSSGTTPIVTIVPDYQTLSRLAADLVAQTAAQSPGCTIALPTGSTPLGMYEELLRRIRQRELDLSRIHFQCLDEYVGVTRDHPNSLTGWLWSTFFDPAGIAPDHVHPLPAAAPDLESAAAQYESALAARGGLELAVLGLGANGHIAYNEPGSTAASRTRTLPLTPESIAQAATYWHGETQIPHTAMTIGVGTLLDARRIALIVSGPAKADILRRTLADPISAALPASWLRLAGNRLTIIADAPAATLIAD